MNGNETEWFFNLTDNLEFGVPVKISAQEILQNYCDDISSRLFWFVLALLIMNIGKDTFYKFIYLNTWGKNKSSLEQLEFYKGFSFSIDCIAIVLLSFLIVIGYVAK